MSETREQFLGRRAAVKLVWIAAGPILSFLLYWRWFGGLAAEGKFWQAVVTIVVFFAFAGAAFLVNLIRAAAILDSLHETEIESLKSRLAVLEQDRPAVEIALAARRLGGVQPVELRNASSVSVIAGLQLNRLKPVKEEKSEYLLTVEAEFAETDLPLLDDRDSSAEHLNPGRKCAFALALVDDLSGRTFICQVEGSGAMKSAFSYSCKERSFSGFELPPGEYDIELLAHAAAMAPLVRSFRLAVAPGSFTARATGE